jgi:hypothetical protein
MSEARAKQVLFWKKHQTMLQMCADLTKRCGAKVLVRKLISFRTID